MQDHPPQNRAQRRAAAKGKGRAPVMVRPFQSQSRNAPQSPATGTGVGYAEADPPQEDTPQESLGFGGFPSLVDDAPRAAAKSHKRGAGKVERVREGLITIYGFTGMMVRNVNINDGLIITASAEKLADAWIDAGKADARIMRVLEIITVAGPFTGLFFAHAGVAMAIMQNHGTSPMDLFKRVPSVPPDGQMESASPPPLPYQPVGPSAPVDTMPPPAVALGGDTLRVFPEEGLPADLDVALRQLARQPGQPSYETLRDQAMLELAQARMAQNGHVQAPGALGMPVAKE